jgi:hypothetical protein
LVAAMDANNFYSFMAATLGSAIFEELGILVGFSVVLLIRNLMMTWVRQKSKIDP